MGLCTLLVSVEKCGFPGPRLSQCGDGLCFITTTAFLELSEPEHWTSIKNLWMKDTYALPVEIGLGPEGNIAAVEGGCRGMILVLQSAIPQGRAHITQKGSR